MAKAWKFALSTFLPFRCTFRRLNLEECWWHRLSVVLFCAALLSTVLISAGLSYLTLAPQVKTPPEILLAANPSAESGAQSSQTAAYSNDSHGVDIPPPPDGSGIVDAPSDSTRAQPNTVPIPAGAQVDHSQNANPACITPPPGFVLEDPQSCQQANVTPAMPASKTVEMPNGATVNFPASMSDDAVRAQWMRLKHRQSLSATLLAALIAIGSTLILSYLLQVSYRALLYVIFGGKPSIASESVTT